MTLATPKRHDALLMAFILGFALFFGVLSLQQHATYQTHGLDVGNVDQALWNTAQGRFLEFSLMAPVESRLALHVEPILLLFMPFYWLSLGGPELLLISQAVVVAVGAYPLYRIAQSMRLTAPDETDDSWMPYLLLVFPLGYLLTPTLQSAVLFEFHAVTFAPTFILWGWWLMICGRTGWFVGLMVLTMACKEDMPLLVAMIGLYLLTQRRWRLGGRTIALSAIWFTLAFFLIQPYFATGGNIQLDRYAWLGDSPLEMVQTALTNPQRIIDHLWGEVDLLNYLFQLFLPTAFLSLLSPLTLLPMAPTLAINLLSANPFTWRLEDFHYGAPLAPLLWISAVYGVRNFLWLGVVAQERIVRSRSNYLLPGKGRFRGVEPRHSLVPTLLLILTCTLFYHSQRGYTPFSQAFHWPEQTDHHATLAQVIEAIPDEVPLFTQPNLAPHLSQRHTIYTEFDLLTDPTFPDPRPIEQVLLDTTSFENIGGLHQFLRQHLLDSGQYRLLTATDGILHLERQASDPIQLPPDFELHTATSAPTYPVQATFGEHLRLHGLDLHFDRQEELQATLYLELLRTLKPSFNLRPVLYLLDEMGTPLGATTDEQPALVWFPFTEGQAGEIRQVRFNTVPWHTRERLRYRLAMGVVRGDDPWLVTERLRPQVNPADVADFAPRLIAQQSLLELGRIEQNWGIPSGGPMARQFSPRGVYQPNYHNFADQVALSGTRRELANNELKLTLIWRRLGEVEDEIPENLTRFVQLLGADGQIYAQQDSLPDRGQYPLTLWQTGEVVSEQVDLILPAGHPTPTDQIILGWYDPATGQRLSVINGGDYMSLPMPR